MYRSQPEMLFQKDMETWHGAFIFAIKASRKNGSHITPSMRPLANASLDQMRHLADASLDQMCNLAIWHILPFSPAHQSLEYEGRH